jgi:hypothetical protein
MDKKMSAMDVLRQDRTNMPILVESLSKRF